MMCFPFHDWEKWKEYEQQYACIVGFYIDGKGKEVPRIRLRQRRQCKKCGKVQDKIVAEFHTG